jgi:hypothetical protein
VFLDIGDPLLNGFAGFEWMRDRGAPEPGGADVAADRFRARFVFNRFSVSRASCTLAFAVAIFLDRGGLALFSDFGRLGLMPNVSKAPVPTSILFTASSVRGVFGFAFTWSWRSWRANLMNLCSLFSERLSARPSR